MTQDVSAWKCESQEWGSMDVPVMREKERLCSYEGFVEGWSSEWDVRGLDTFSRLLLAACRGKEDPRLLV